MQKTDTPLSLTALLFDFDYTLADSSAGAVDCTNYALQTMGLAPCAAPLICQTIGLSLCQSYHILTGDQTPGQGHLFRHLFIQRADQVMAANTRFYPEVFQMLPALKHQGFKLGIVSTKFRYRIQSLLERDALSSYFDVIIGGEDVARPKPDPEGVQQALRTLQVSHSQCLYIGDSCTDAETAQHAAVRFAAVCTGTTPAEDFSHYHPLLLYPNLNALCTYLSHLP